MKESLGPRSSSTLQPAPPPEPRARRTLALSGPSVRLDPRTHAVRGDLADVRLAEQVFAPHYAAPMPCIVARATSLMSRADGGEAVATLAAGEPFELLELSGRHGWGIAPAAGLVGYCDRDALEIA